MSVVSRLFCAGLAGSLIACVRPPEPSASSATREPAPSAAAHAAPSTHAEHARSERKPDTGARIVLELAPTQSDSTELTVRVTATRAMPASKLRIGTELPARVDGVAEWSLAPMIAGAVVTRTVRVHRGQTGGAVGALVTASVEVGAAGDAVTDMEVTWAFGPADPARVLERSSLELGEDGVGSLGPGDRVVRTPEGERVHESIAR